MSLLMKALEKAAKDRVDARSTEPVAAVPAAAAPSARSELTLEPMNAEAPAAPARAEAPAGAAASSRSAAGATAREQAKAATLLNAGSRVSGEALVQARARPVLVVGVVAALIAIGFGTYVYLQVFHPSLFYGQPAIAPKPPAFPLSQQPAPPPQAAGTVATAPQPPLPAATVAAAPQPPLPATTVLQDKGFDPPPAPPTPSLPVAKPAAKPQPTEPAAAPDAARAPKAPRDAIVVSRGSAAPAVNPLLTEAYSAFQSGGFESAQRAYEQLLRAEPRNTDALLGLAAIATLETRNEEAIRRYLQVLDLEPRHALAQSGLIGLLGRADPLAAEARLKQLIAREPSGFLYFTLGNLYADQSQWAGAQQAYFQAHHLEPGNPNYAYNLAVGLDHVSQPKLALGFYRRAVQLAAGSPGRTQFNLALAQERISKLASQVE